MHFGGQFEHETHFCEICVKTAERQPKGQLRFCLQGTQTKSDNKSEMAPASSPIITSDETWVYDYHPETKQHSSQWNSPN
jgi:hypothetical protein